MPSRSLAWTIAFGLLLAACREPAPDSPSVGTNSNWLRKCSSDTQCGDLPACVCSACTAECMVDSDCDDLGEGRCVRAADVAAQAACASATPDLTGGMCLPRCEPGSCGENQACVDRACVRADLPDVPFCAGVAEVDPDDQTAQDALLELYMEQRANGGASCGGMPATAPAPGLRFDARLVCAARVLAADIAVTRATNLTDSQGRTTRDRMSAVGYVPRVWAESFAVEATSAGRALQLVFADPGSCTRLSSADYREVGIGSSGDVHVILIGRE